MLPARIGLTSQSTSVDFSALVRVANALTLQVSRDLAPIWNVAGSIVALEDPDHIDPGIWPVYIVDQLDAGLGGFHQTEHNQPFAMVLAGDTWSLSASHEALEMLVDPSGNRLIASAAVGIVDNEVQDVAGKFEYLLEVCDPSEDQTCAYLIDDVLVSDFYTPSYFDPAGSAGARYSFSGKLTRPRQVLPNGYLSWYNPANNKIQQVKHFGAPEIVDLGTGKPGGGSLTGGRSLRSFVDSKTPPPVTLSSLHSSSNAVARLNKRVRFLATAAPSRATMFAAAASRLMGGATASPAPQDAKAALAANVGRFAVPGVLSVRSGYQSSPRGLTGDPAIVVVASPDKQAAVKAVLPEQINGVPVDVRAANPMQQLRAQHPADFTAMAAARHELRQPEFADEVFFDGNGQRSEPHALLEMSAAARRRKPQIDYTAPTGVTLDAVEETVTLVLHASPDAGWEQLSAFLTGVEKELVVGMYDFTSAHILQAVEDVMRDDGRSLTLTLDHPAPNPSRDQTDEDTQKALADEMGVRFKGAWALTNSDAKAPVWIYPNAYHIKVAVREDDTFWLSSGNWNNSNQPEIDLSDETAARKIAAAHDRDWHVIATSPALAAKFRAFLRNDNEVARTAETQAATTAALAAAAAAETLPEVPVAVLAAGRQPRSFFPAKTLRGSFRIQPLLTPDNYKEHVKPLIESARSRFYMQTQYIHPSGREGDEDHDALIAAVKALIDQGVDVRLITSEFQSDDWVEKLVDAGIPASVLRRQNKVHNKGIVVDSSVVMVSSQNWSADGTLRNRDAGLIIHSAEAAAYFEPIFLHDWDHLASPVAAS